MLSTSVIVLSSIAIIGCHFEWRSSPHINWIIHWVVKMWLSWVCHPISFRNDFLILIRFFYFWRYELDLFGTSQLIWFFGLFQFLGFEHLVALGTSLLGFLVLRVKPLICAVNMEEMAACWDLQKRISVHESIHTNDTVVNFKLIVMLIILRGLQTSFEFQDILLGQFLQLLFHILFWALDRVFRMLLLLPLLLSIGDLSLETANVVDSYLVLIPLWVYCVDIIVNSTQWLWVTAG